MAQQYTKVVNGVEVGMTQEEIQERKAEEAKEKLKGSDNG
jgi:hypothetical protein